MHGSQHTKPALCQRRCRVILRVSVARHGSPQLENSTPWQTGKLCLAFAVLLNGCSLVVDTSVPDVPAMVRGAAGAAGIAGTGGVPIAGAHSGGVTAIAGAATYCDIEGLSCASGLTCADGESCCKSLLVPGGTYNREDRLSRDRTGFLYGQV